MIVTASGNTVGNANTGVFSIPLRKYCPELDDVIRVAKFKGYKIPTDYQLRVANVFLNELKACGVYGLSDLLYLFGWNSLSSVADDRFNTNANFLDIGFSNFTFLNYIKSDLFECSRFNLGSNPSFPYHHISGWKNLVGSTSGNDGYLNTNWSPVDGINFLQNSASISCYAGLADITGAAGTNGEVYGLLDSGGSITFRPSNGTNAAVRMNTSTAAANTMANSTDRGYYVVSRTASNLTSVYRNGALLGTTNRASVSLTTSNKLFILANNNINGSTISGFFKYPVSYFRLGAGLSSTMQKIEYDLFTEFRTKLGYQ